MKNFWNERYGGDEYVYGTAPNEFLKEEIEDLDNGKALFIAEGEGRNAVLAAQLGWDVTALDYSKEAKKKAMQLAAERGVSINYIIDDVINFDFGFEQFDLIVLIYGHFPKELVSQLLPKIEKSLKPEGLFLAEVFSENQLGRSSGGPKSKDMLYTTPDFKNGLGSLEISYLRELDIHLDEGAHHTGDASVIRVIASKSC